MDTRIRVLRRVVTIEGSELAVARRLKVRSSYVSAWLTGSQPIPEAVFMQAVEIILDEAPRSAALPLPIGPGAA